MPFGRSAKPNNRSQHNLAVESIGPSSSAGAPSLSVGVSSTSSGAGTGPGPVSGIQGIPGIGVSTSGAQAQHVNHQHPPGPGPGPGPGLTQLQVQGPSSSASASGQGPANLPLTTNDSFVQDLRAVSQGHQFPPPQLYGPSSGQDLPPASQGLNQHHSQAQAQLHQLHPLNTSNVVSDAEARKAASKFVDAVTRSQSQRYNTVATPVQPNPSFGASYEDLTRSLQATPQDQQSFAYHHHHHHQHQQQQQQQQQRQHAPPPQPPPQSAPVEPKRSTRRLIKNILGGTPRSDTSRSGHSHHPSESQSQSQSHNFYDNTAGLARRPSKRISNPNPPALRNGPSQISLDQQSLDWQSQGPQSQPSPLQIVRAPQFSRWPSELGH